MDARHRRRPGKPEQSGLARIEEIRSLPAQPLQNLNPSPIPEPKPSGNSGDAEFLGALAKIVGKKKKQS